MRSSRPPHSGYSDRVEFNDGSQYRIVSDPSQQLAQRSLFMGRAASGRNGALYVDTAFPRHRDVLAGMPALCWYQYPWINLGTPEDHATFFCNALGGALRWNEMVMIDPEAGGGFTSADVQAWVARWLAVTESVLATKAWMYVPSTLAAGLPRAFTADRIIMAPRYSGTDAHGAEPWWPWDVHQYTDRGPFPGCAQTGDTSHTTLTAEQLLARCNPSGLGASPCRGGQPL